MCGGETFDQSAYRCLTVGTTFGWHGAYVFWEQSEASGERGDSVRAALQARNDRAWAQELEEQTAARVAAAHKSELAHEEQLAAAQMELEEHLQRAETALLAAEEGIEAAAASGAHKHTLEQS